MGVVTTGNAERKLLKKLAMAFLFKDRTHLVYVMYISCMYHHAC